MGLFSSIICPGPGQIMYTICSHNCMTHFQIEFWIYTGHCAQFNTPKAQALCGPGITTFPDSHKVLVQALQGGVGGTETAIRIAWSDDDLRPSSRIRFDQKTQNSTNCTHCSWAVRAERAACMCRCTCARRPHMAPPLNLRGLGSCLEGERWCCYSIIQTKIWS